MTVSGTNFLARSRCTTAEGGAWPVGEPLLLWSCARLGVKSSRAVSELSKDSHECARAWVSEPIGPPCPLAPARVSPRRPVRRRRRTFPATWLMMAKLGDFDDLPSNAQSFLINYRTQLATMSEAEFTALAIREVYSDYYKQMGGVGAAPELKPRTQTTNVKVVRPQRRPRPQPGLSAARHSTTPMSRKSLPALLILASMSRRCRWPASETLNKYRKSVASRRNL